MDHLLDTLSMYLEAYREEIGWGLLITGGLALIWVFRSWWNRRQDEVALAREAAANRCFHGVRNRGSGCRKCARRFAEEVAKDKPGWRYVVECDECHGIFDDLSFYLDHRCGETV